METCFDNKRMQMKPDRKGVGNACCFACFTDDDLARTCQAFSSLLHVLLVRQIIYTAFHLTSNKISECL